MGGYEMPGTANQAGEELEMPPLEPLPSQRTLSPKQQRLKNWQGYYNAAIKGSGLPSIAVDGLWGPQTSEARRTVKQSGARNLKEFGDMARAIGAKSLMEMRTQLWQRQPMSGQKMPPEPPQAPMSKTPLKMRPQDAEALLMQKFQQKFSRLPLGKAPELVTVLKQKANELFNAGYSPDELDKQFSAFVGRIQPSDVKQFIQI